MRIEIVKRDDGAGVLRCTRADGSITWQKQYRHGAFFALHDLTHFAVESVLGLRGGFFGLVAGGWEIDDTTGKGARGPLPEEATGIERIVGLLDSERASGALMTATELNGYESFRVLTDEELVRIRAKRSELFRAWGEIKPGQALALEWAT